MQEMWKSIANLISVAGWLIDCKRVLYTGGQSGKRMTESRPLASELLVADT
jgi:hypothetical protein